jgi:Xaa-Pro aminopeptidase
MPSLVQEKVDQAVNILQEMDVDLWLTFVRETGVLGDPVLPLILGSDLTWVSALLITRHDERLAIVGDFEAEATRRAGAYGEVTPYTQSIRPALLEVLQLLNPQSVAVNYSLNDSTADGLTHGMYQLLNTYLEGTPFSNRLVSAEKVIAALRGRKTSEEVRRIRTAVESTQRIFEATVDYVKTGMTERQIADFMQNQVKALGLDLAWEPELCPIVNAGPDSIAGHAAHRFWGQAPELLLGYAKGGVFPHAG